MEYNLGGQDVEAAFQVYEDIFKNLKELIIMQRVNQIPNEMPYP